MNIEKVPSVKLMALGTAILISGFAIQPESNLTVFLRVLGWTIYCVCGGIGTLKHLDSKAKLKRDD